MNRHSLINDPVAASGGHSLSSTLCRLLLLLVIAMTPLLGSGVLQAQESPPAQSSALVNINRADAAALAAGLNGVGLARAQEIVRHREAYGPFASIEELAEVKGIGPATIDRNRAVITLE